MKGKLTSTIPPWSSERIDDFPTLSFNCIISIVLITNIDSILKKTKDARSSPKRIFILCYWNSTSFIISSPFFIKDLGTEFPGKVHEGFNLLHEILYLLYLCSTRELSPNPHYFRISSPPAFIVFLSDRKWWEKGMEVSHWLDRYGWWLRKGCLCEI